MSYVIQNFHRPSSYLVITPRFKVMLVHKWLNFFFFFFKYPRIFGNNNHFFSFLKFFFKKGLILFFYNLQINLFGNYTNNVTRTFQYFNLTSIDYYFKNGNFIKNSYDLDRCFILNKYYFSVKLVNMKITKTYFKLMFYFVLLTFSELWYQPHNHMFFYLNFFFIRNNLKLYKFYNGYFLRIYNY